MRGESESLYLLFLGAPKIDIEKNPLFIITVHTETLPPTVLIWVQESALILENPVHILSCLISYTDVSSYLMLMSICYACNFPKCTMF